MAETSTRNAQLAELAAAAHDFLDAHAGMPDVSTVSVSNVFDTTIKLQIARGDVRAIAEWAQTLGAQVTFIDGGNYVEVFTVAAFGAHAVRLWTHIRGLAAWKLLVVLDLELKRDQPVEVDSARILESLSAVDGV